MPLPAQYARMVLYFVDNDKKIWSNIFWFELGGTFPSNFDIAAAANALQTNFITQLLDVLDDTTQFLGLDLRINNNGVTSDASTFPAGAMGTDTGGGIPNEVAAVVHWATAQPGGSGRGRSFITGFTASEVAGGRVSTALNGFLGAFAAKLLTAFTNQGITYGLRLLSKKNNSMYVIASFVVDALVGTQRKRRPIR